MEHGITWGGLFLAPLQDILARFGVDPHVGANLVLGSGLLILLAYFGGRPFRKGLREKPSANLGLAFFLEFLLENMLAFFSTIIHDGARKLFPILGTLAFFILIHNLLGLAPGYGSSTDQFNVTIALALVTFCTSHFIGIMAHGWAYPKKFMGPLWWIAPLIFPIEIISHLVRPLSLAMRLFGNMTGDHKVLVVFTSLLAVGLPIPFLGLGIFVSVLQTFVFVLLSCVYFQDALEEAH